MAISKKRYSISLQFEDDLVDKWPRIIAQFSNVVWRIFNQLFTDTETFQSDLPFC